MGNIFKNNRIIHLDEVDSTNSFVNSKYPGRSLPEGSVIWANNQKKGKGTGQNKWHSEAGKNLTCSVVLYPEFLSPDKQFYVSKALSLAVADLVGLYTDKVSIKWPNDIYVGDKKISGLLIEHTIERNQIKSTIAGIGINVNQKIFPESLPNPISLAKATKQSFELEELVVTLSDLIEYRYSLLKDGELEMLDENYLDLLYHYKKVSLYEIKGKRFAGSIEGVDPTGELVIKNEKSEYLHFGYKEVEYVIG